ncbi:MAG: orotidine-5'-phosphate decarboxylase [Acidimicrobiales bacterium]
MSTFRDDARQHLALALDIDDLVAALRIAKPLTEYFAVAKIGLELFTAAGPESIVALSSEGYEVFVDLKLHDIPTTVGRAARVLGALGVSYATVHTSGGHAMVEAATAGMADGAHSAGLPTPSVLGVTVLTSDSEASTDVLTDRARIALESGCGGVVCAGADVAVVKNAAPGLLLVVPGIRPAQTALDDQARVATPAAAIAAGADLLVIGRAVTASPDPEATSARIRDEVAAVLGEMSPC